MNEETRRCEKHGNVYVVGKDMCHGCATEAPSRVEMLREQGFGRHSLDDETLKAMEEFLSCLMVTGGATITRALCGRYWEVDLPSGLWDVDGSRVDRKAARQAFNVVYTNMLHRDEPDIF